MGDKHEDEAKAFRDYVEKAMGEFVGERLDDPTLAERVAKKLEEIVESIDMPPSITLATGEFDPDEQRLGFSIEAPAGYFKREWLKIDPTLPPNCIAWETADGTRVIFKIEEEAGND